MNWHLYRSAAISPSRWFFGLLLIFLVTATGYYALASDKYAVSAVVNAKTDETKSFDLGTLGGLAQLASSGQRPLFEQFGCLLEADPVIRAVLPTVSRTSPKLAEELLRRSAFQNMRFHIERGARALFGKPPLLFDADQAMIETIRKRLTVSKTPEGFMQIGFQAENRSGQRELVRALLAEADGVIRAREGIAYGKRVQTYQRLIDQQTRVSERAVLVALIGREYGNYVAAQEGETFSYMFINPPLSPAPIYSPSLILCIFVAIIATFIFYSLFVLAKIWMNSSR
jgi:hypothetical protein